MKFFPVLTFVITFICIASFFFKGVGSVFIFDRAAVLNGEFWRIFSCHWIHFSSTHLIYNLCVFIAAGWIVEKNNYRHFIFLYALTAVFICAALLIFLPDMAYYGGLSGIDCGLIYYCALLKKNQQHWKIICQFIIAFIPVKTAIELYNNNSVLPYFEDQPFVIMPASHIAGVIAAFLFYLTLKYLKKANKNMNYFNS